MTQQTPRDDRNNYSFLYRNGLSIFFILIFLVTLLAQALTGWKVFNESQSDNELAAISFWAYLGTGHFMSATFENFESEFLQMAMYVILTIHLRQIGSAESKQLGHDENADHEPQPNAPGAPWPVRRGGFILKLYSHSLSIAFALLFFASWALHFVGSLRDYNHEQAAMNQPLVSAGAYLLEPQFWFETFQNWQSEFLSVAAIVILTIFLRQKGSPQSKPVDAPTWQTGE